MQKVITKTRLARNLARGRLPTSGSSKGYTSRTSSLKRTLGKEVDGKTLGKEVNGKTLGKEMDGQVDGAEVDGETLEKEMSGVPAPGRMHGMRGRRRRRKKEVEEKGGHPHPLHPSKGEKAGTAPGAAPGAAGEVTHPWHPQTAGVPSTESPGQR